MRKIPFIIILACAVLLIGCGHEHQWIDATCTEPRTCSECGKTEGEALGHEWIEATCTEAKHCSRCGETEGEPLEHEWEDATCTEARYCKVCGRTDGEPLGHDWMDATHEAPKTCSRCGETEGKPLLYDTPAGFSAEHVFGDYSKFSNKSNVGWLQGVNIWLNGSFENISTLDLSGDPEYPMNEYICEFTDQDGNKWLMELDLDYYTAIDKYTDLSSHSLCVLGLFNGFSEDTGLPAFIMESIFDRETGNTIDSQWYKDI